MYKICMCISMVHATTHVLMLNDQYVQYGIATMTPYLSRNIHVQQKHCKNFNFSEYPTIDKITRIHLRPYQVLFVSNLPVCSV